MIIAMMITRTMNHTRTPRKLLQGLQASFPPQGFCCCGAQGDFRTPQVEGDADATRASQLAIVYLVNEFLFVIPNCDNHNESTAPFVRPVRISESHHFA